MPEQSTFIELRVLAGRLKPSDGVIPDSRKSEKNGEALIMTDVDANIRVKRIYDAPAEDDGRRVLVDRLWPRGMRKDEANLALWLKEIAPTPDLRKWFDHDAARFEEFSRRYQLELAANKEVVDRLKDMLEQGRITLLYAAHDANHNNAIVLAGYLQARRKAET